MRTALSISSRLQIAEGVRIRVDGKYLVTRTLDRAQYVSLNACSNPVDFGAWLDLPPGFTTVELVSVTGEVVATHTAPPRTAIDDHVEQKMVVWGTADSVESRSWFADATDGVPPTDSTRFVRIHASITGTDDTMYMFQALEQSGCQAHHAFVYDGAYGPGPFEGHASTESGCTGR